MGGCPAGTGVRRGRLTGRAGVCFRPLRQRTADVGHQPGGLHHVGLQGTFSERRNGPAMNTGPVGAGREAETAISRCVRTCEPKSAHPEVRTQKECLTLGARCASAPRMHLRPGWNRGPGGVRLELERSGGWFQRRTRGGRGARAGPGQPIRTSLPSIGNVCPESVASVAPEVRRVFPS